MSKQDIIVIKVSARSKINQDDCTKVLDAFEEILSERLSNSNSISGAFDKIYNVMSFIKNKKTKN